MRTTVRISWIAVLLLAVAVATMSCSSSGGGGGSNPLATLLAAEDGFVLEADPIEVVIDTTDPDADTDPDTGRFFADVELKAIATDPDGVPQAELEVAFSTTAGVLESGGEPRSTDEDGIALDRLRVFEDDPDEITVMATDGDRTETVTLSKTVIFPNRPPVADAGEDRVLDCGDDASFAVVLDGTGSTDPDSTPDTNDDIVLYEWFLDFGGPEETVLGEGPVIEVVLGSGVHPVTLRVTDSEGETSTDEVTVEIVDTTPPIVTAHADPGELWPPNHRMEAIHVELQVVDCSPYEVVLESVTSSEPMDAVGDGNTEPDIEGAEIGTEDYDLFLRAERSGGGTGRVYTITYRVVDAAGLETLASAFVVVPHDQGL